MSSYIECGLVTFRLLRIKINNVLWYGYITIGSRDFCNRMHFCRRNMFLPLWTP
jgi:hypothetical protein